MWDFDYLWHFLGGLGIGLAFCLPAFFGWTFVPFIGVILITLFGYIREKVQHDFNPLSQHQWIEAITWGLGGLTSLFSLFGLA
jgi:hypothetical protein